MKDITVLIIPGCFAVLIALALAAILSVGPFSEPLPTPPASMASQCKQAGKWCLGDVCGGCARGKPATFAGLGL